MLVEGQGIVAVVGARKREQLRQSLDALDISLSGEDLVRIS